jgi:hypothetical protein
MDIRPSVGNWPAANVILFVAGSELTGNLTESAIVEKKFPLGSVKSGATAPGKAANPGVAMRTDFPPVGTVIFGLLGKVNVREVEVRVWP